MAIAVSAAGAILEWRGGAYFLLDSVGSSPRFSSSYPRVVASHSNGGISLQAISPRREEIEIIGAGASVQATAG